MFPPPVFPLSAYLPPLLSVVHGRNLKDYPDLVSPSSLKFKICMLLFQIYLLEISISLQTHQYGFPCLSQSLILKRQQWNFLFPDVSLAHSQDHFSQWSQNDSLFLSCLSLKTSLIFLDKNIDCLFVCLLAWLTRPSIFWPFSVTCIAPYMFPSQASSVQFWKGQSLFCCWCQPYCFFSPEYSFTVHTFSTHLLAPYYTQNTEIET